MARQADGGRGQMMTRNRMSPAPFRPLTPPLGPSEEALSRAQVLLRLTFSIYFIVFIFIRSLTVMSSSGPFKRDPVSRPGPLAFSIFYLISFMYFILFRHLTLMSLVLLWALRKGPC